MRQIITTALCVFLFAVLAQAAAYGEAKVITIGGIVTLSGEGAPYGINAQRGAILAIEEINSASHGIPFKVIWEDEIGGKAEKAVTAYKKLTQIDGVSIIFGPTYLDGLFAIAPLAKKDGKLLVTASNPALSISNVFSTWVDPRQEAETMAKHIASSHKRVAVLSCQQAWDAIVGKHFRDSFTATGGEIVYLTEPLPDTTDLKPEGQTIKARCNIYLKLYTIF
jgi:ABC-type branched-subunit amino acid transport system substrate-binding protein